MKLGKARVSGTFGATVILVGPIAFVGSVLLAIAVAHDFAYFFGDTPFALGLFAPAAYLITRWAVPRVRERVHAALIEPPLSDLSAAE